MNRIRTILGICLTLALAAGCIPEKRIAWSPDGKRAAVMSEDALHFIDGDGNLLPLKLAATKARCEWFPDGSRLLVRHSIKAHSWDEVGGLFNEQETARIKTEAQGLRERILAYTGNWDAFKFEPGEHASPGMTIAVILYLRDRLPEGLPEKLGDKWKEAKDMEVDTWHLQLFNVSETEIKPADVLLRTLEPIASISVSPNGKAVAYIAPASSEDATPALYVLPIGGGRPLQVATGVATRYDWSPDGRSIAYIRSMNPVADNKDNVQLGELATVAVTDPDGSVIKESLEPKSRVGLLFSSQLDVHWLADGRILFTSVEMTLPATSREMPQQWMLFALDPKMPAGVIRVIGRDLSEPLDPSWPMALPSPDGKRVLLPGPKGGWTLYEIESGRATVVVASGKDDVQQYSLPTWRSNSEVCLVVPIAVEGTKEVRGKVILWSDGQAKSISDKWPEEVLAGWTSDK